DERGLRLPDRDPGVLCGAAAAQACAFARRGGGAVAGMSRPRYCRPRRMIPAPGIATCIVAALLLQVPAMSAPAPKRDLGPLPAPKPALVPFETTPFPYRGIVPEKNKPFLDVADGARLGHNSARGGTYWEDQTYNDQRVLLHIPK